MVADTEQPDEDVCDMGAEYPSVCVKFVDNYEFQFAEESSPGAMET